MDRSEPLYNSRIFDTFLRLVRRRYPQVNVPELMAHAGMKAYEVDDPGHWFSQEQANRFHDRLVQMTGNEAIAREAGRFVASPEALGIIKHGFISMLGPARAFELANKAAASFTRTSTFESRRLAANKVELTTRFREGVHEQPYQCENRMGTFEAILMMFDYGLPQIDHPECIFHGGACCRYVIAWEPNPAENLVRLRNAALPLLAALNVGTVAVAPALTLELILPASAGAFLVLAYLAERRGRRGLQNVLRRLEEPTDKLIERINANYSNAQITNEVGQAISRQTSIDGIIASVLHILEQRIGYERGVILLADGAGERLLLQAGFGLTTTQSDALRAARFDLKHPGSGPFLTAYRGRQPILVASAAEYAGMFPDGGG